MARGSRRDDDRDYEPADDGEFYILRGGAMRRAIDAMFGTGTGDDDGYDDDDYDDRPRGRRSRRDDRDDDDRRDPPPRSGSRFFR